MANYNTECLCVRCKHLRPALDPNIQKAYLGKCVKREWPFTLSITLQGWTECDVFEASGKTYVPPEPVAAKAAVAASGARAAKRVEFYYSSAQKPGEMFPCDIKRALQLVKDLQGAGVDSQGRRRCRRQGPVPHLSQIGQRPGCDRTPGLRRQRRIGRGLWNHCPRSAVFEGDRYPVMVFPRTDAKRGTIRVEQALEDLVAETAATPVAK